MIGIISDKQDVIDYANKVANDFRIENKNVSVNYDNRKVGDIMKIAEKNNIKEVVIIGEKEAESKVFEVKSL